MVDLVVLSTSGCCITYFHDFTVEVIAKSLFKRIMHMRATAGKERWQLYFPLVIICSGQGYPLQLE